MGGVQGGRIAYMQSKDSWPSPADIPTIVDIFVSHSSADTELVGIIEEAFSEVGVNGYFSEFKMEGKAVPDKLRDAIRSSQAVVVLWTANVSDVPRTRDVVNAEI